MKRAVLARVVEERVSRCVDGCRLDLSDDDAVIPSLPFLNQRADEVSLRAGEEGLAPRADIVGDALKLVGHLARELVGQAGLFVGQNIDRERAGSP